MRQCNFFGSYVSDACPADTNLVSLIQEAELVKYPDSYLENEGLVLKKIAIDAPAGELFSINGNMFKMPSTGMFETSWELIDIVDLRFENSVAVNIAYFY